MITTFAIGLYHASIRNQHCPGGFYASAPTRLEAMNKAYYRREMYFKKLDQEIGRERLIHAHCECH